MIVENDPPMGAKAVYCSPENYEEMEIVVVPAEDRGMEKYSGYALVIPLAEFDDKIKPVS